MPRFDLKPTISIYDLTNIFFEGLALKQPKMKRGPSKDKRCDGIVLTLRLVLNGSGFVRRSKVHIGHVFEAHTLKTILQVFSAELGSCIVMDTGIAFVKNLA